MKTCYQCKEIKILSEFAKNKGMKDGCINLCKMCMRLYCNQYRKYNKNILLKKKKEERQLNRVRYNARALKVIRENPEKYR